jgi:hypothetical protein
MLKEENKDLVVEGAIIGLKMTSGEEIMAKIGKISGDSVELLLPHSLVAAEGGAAFMAWPSMASDEPVLTYRSRILVAYKLRSDFYENYAPMHGVKAKESKSGVFMPPEKKLIV